MYIVSFDKLETSLFVHFGILLHTPVKKTFHRRCSLKFIYNPTGKLCQHKYLNLSNTIIAPFNITKLMRWIMLSSNTQTSLQVIITKYLFLFLSGGFAYFYIEILFRGYSHFSMIVCGGLAFVLCGMLNQVSPRKLSFLTQIIISCFIITILEFITGYIVNIKLGWAVWDYSHLPYNLYGQICPAFSLIWLVLSSVCIFMDDFIRWKIFDEERVRYKWL